MNPLQQLQGDTTNFLLGNPRTIAVPFKSLRKMTIESAQDEAQAAWDIRVDGKIGLACLVMMPKARCKDPNVPGPQLVAELTIRTFEDPKINNHGADFSAESVAIANLSWLDGLMINGVTMLYTPDKEDAIKPNYDYPGMLVYDSVLLGELPQDFAGRTASPEIADDDAGTVTLACSDPAAVIYYTIDGSMPVPGTVAGAPGSTQVYSAPFHVDPATVIRCLAWNPAALPSAVDKATINYQLQ